MKHIDIKYHFIRVEIDKGKLKIEYIPIKRQQADIMTNGLPTKQFADLRKALGTLH